MLYYFNDSFHLFFSSAHIPLYLYPFLNTTSKSRPFEYLRLTSLGVIGALVKVLLPYSFWCWVEITARWPIFHTVTFLLQKLIWNNNKKLSKRFITKSSTQLFIMEWKSNNLFGWICKLVFLYFLFVLYYYY